MANKFSGILITVEGIDGAGKSSLIQNLVPHLKTLTPEVVATKEPGGSQLGVELRKLLQYPVVPVAPRAEYLLFAADRAQHFHDLVIPALKQGDLVISDRMADSSLAYQGYGRGHDFALLNIINQWSMHGIIPDLTIYLKIPVTVAYERMQARGEKKTVFETEKQEFLEGVARGFDTLFSQRSSVLIIDATQDSDQITRQAYEYIKTWAIPTHNIIINHPAHLFVGNDTVVNTQIISQLQKILCPQDGCTYCSTCLNLYKHTHAQLMWLEPDGNYTREMIQPILQALSLQQDIDKHFFIVITHAERLQQTSANALLKSLEEPPQGYHFLLTTAQPQVVIATIRSRCIIHDLNNGDMSSSPENKLSEHFTGTTYCDPAAFLLLLDTLDLSDQQSYEQLDNIIATIGLKLKQAYITESYSTAEHLTVLVNIYKEAINLPPQSGSSKIFWKNLYLKTDRSIVNSESIKKD